MGEVLEPGIWKGNVKFHSYDVDFDGKATVESMLRHFLEAAWSHAEALGAGFGHLAVKNSCWVLSRLLMRMEVVPTWGFAGVLETWPRPAKGIFALRDFEIRDGAGNRFVGGTSAWLVLNLDTRRPQRLDSLPRPVPAVGKSALGRDPVKLPPTEAGTVETSRRAEFSDLDVNNHVNSARYIAWLTDSYPREFLKRHEPRTLEVNYLGETHAGQTVSIRSQQIGATEFLHSVARADEGLCRARLEWSPKPEKL